MLDGITCQEYIGSNSSSIIMHIGVCQIKVRFPDSLSLKEKRGVLKSIIARLRNRFNISVAETGDQDLWQTTTLGICCVSNDKRHANEVLSKVADFVINSRFDVEVLDYQIEILSVF